MNSVLYEAAAVDTYALVLRDAAGVAQTPIVGVRDGVTLNYAFDIAGLAEGVYGGTVFSSAGKRRASVSDLVWDGTTIITLADVLALLASSSGSGAFAVTLTFDDGAEPSPGPVAGVLVRVSEVGGARTYTAVTDADGKCAFSLDAGSWLVSATKPLFGFTPQVLVVNGTETQTYSLTPLAIAAAPDPSLCQVVATCIDEQGVPEAGATVEAKIKTAPAGTGYAFDKVEQLATSDADGIAVLTLVRGGAYFVRRGTQRDVEPITVVLPLDQDVVTIPNFLGK